MSSEEEVAERQAKTDLEFEVYHDAPGDDQGKLLPRLPKDEDHLEPPLDERKYILRTIASLLAIGLVYIVIWLTFRDRREETTLGRPATNNALNFPVAYPKLDAERSTEKCRARWNTLTSIQCHEAIWLRNWDSGTVEIYGPSIPQLVPLICQDRCKDALEEAQKLLESSCVGENAFDLATYKGKFNTTALEANPPTVLNVLVERYTRSCKRTDKNDAEGGWCMGDLESRWGIVDGIRSDGLEGLDRFMDSTSRSRWEGPVRHNDFVREKQVYGPGRGETTCSSCTQSWLAEKTRIWEEGKIIKDGLALTLPEFLRMWERAGRRCKGDGFYVAYHAAIKQYQQKGLLDVNWDSQPSGDIPHLIENGPSRGDYPIPALMSTISTLKQYKSETPGDESIGIIEEYISCLDAFQSDIQSIGCYPFLSFPQLTTYVLSDLQVAERVCSEESLTSIDKLEKQILDNCPTIVHAFKPRWMAYDRILGSQLAFDFSLDEVFGDNGTLNLYKAACHSVRSSGPPCAAIFAQWGMQKWALEKPEPKELIRITRHLLDVLPPMPRKLKEWKRPTDRHLTPDEHQMRKEVKEWERKMEAGVCSDCLWRLSVDSGAWPSGRMYNGPDREVAMEWIKTVHLVKSECAEREKKFEDIEVDKTNQGWKSRYSQELWNEAFSEGREDPSWLTG